MQLLHPVRARQPAARQDLLFPVPRHRRAQTRYRRPRAGRCQRRGEVASPRHRASAPAHYVVSCSVCHRAQGLHLPDQQMGAARSGGGQEPGSEDAPLDRFAAGPRALRAGCFAGSRLRSEGGRSRCATSAPWGRPQGKVPARGGARSGVRACARQPVHANAITRTKLYESPVAEFRDPVIGAVSLRGALGNRLYGSAPLPGTMLTSVSNASSGRPSMQDRTAA